MPKRIEDRQNSQQRGYTKRWEKERRVYLNNNVLCVGCRAAGLIEPASVIDHIIPHKGDSDLFWDQANWQACCAYCHNVVKAELERKQSSVLRLDSVEALLVRKQRPKHQIVDVDGWPIEEGGGG